MNNRVNELQTYFCPFGYSDLKSVCEIGDAVGMRERELFDLLEEERDNLWYENWEWFDPVYSVLDYVLQTARNKIFETIGYDFANDFSGQGSEIHTVWNFMCSSFDYWNEAIDELARKTSSHIKELLDDKHCQYLFNELEIHED